MSYAGGKGGAGVAQQIINQIPPHRVYMEPFAGAGAVLRAKLPAAIAIVGDIDDRVLLEHWQQPIPGLITVHGDALEYLASYRWAGDEFVYCDPPYLLETRSGQRPIYRHEFSSREQHTALITLLRSLPCNVALSGYASPLYAELLHDWRSLSFQTVKRSGEKATECLWMNYPAPLELHDYRYLGSSFRERERIKRKKLRWVQRLRTMPDLERLCLMEAIGELRCSLAGSDEG